MSKRNHFAFPGVMFTYLILFCCSANPAPLDLCLSDKFDSAKGLCPAERTALSAFFIAAKGAEWTTNTNWFSQYDSHCNWYGVECNEDGVVKLDLRNNGLSGTLSKSISELGSLLFLDLSDNDIKVSTCHFRWFEL